MSQLPEAQVTPSEIAERLVESFDPLLSMPLEEAIATVLQDLGLGPIKAALYAERSLTSVNRRLRALDPRVQPFDLREGPRPWLIGKARIRKAEPPTATKIRKTFTLLTEMQEAVHNLGDTAFEWLSAGLMRVSGASDSHATRPGNEGGIDVYGRIPILSTRPDLPPGLIESHLAGTDLLFLGQSKCHAPLVVVQRGTIQEFKEQVRDCLRNYEGWKRRPANAVPSDYYRVDEPALSFFFTTGSFSRGASDAARALSITTIDGREIAQLLLLHGLGLKEANEGFSIDEKVLKEWASRFAPTTNRA